MLVMVEPHQSRRDPSRPPTHPGAILRDIVLGDGKLTKVALAAALGISRQMLYGLLAERHDLTPEMAVRLAYVLGSRAEFWLSLQRAYDLWHAQQRIDPRSLTVLRQRPFPPG